MIERWRDLVNQTRCRKVACVKGVEAHSTTITIWKVEDMAP